MSIGALRRLASLEAALETETAFGGRTRSWSEVATLWVDLSITTGRERGEADQRPVLTETAQAEGRDHPDAAAGQRLVLGGYWRVVRIARSEPRPGRMTLYLERDAS